MVVFSGLEGESESKEGSSWRGLGGLLSILFLLAGGLPGQAPASFPSAPLLPAAPFLREARHVLGLEGGGWNPLGKAPRDPFLSPWVEGVLQDPLSLPGLASRWTSRLRGTGARDALELAFELQGIQVVPAARAELEGVRTVGDILRVLFKDKVPADQAGGLPPRLEGLLFPLVRAAAAARLWCGEARGKMDREKRKEALEGLAGRWTGEREPDRTETGRILGLASGMDGKLLARAARVLSRGLSRALAGRRREGWRTLPSTIEAPGYGGDLRLFLPTPWGDIVVGGPGATIYRKRAFVILDLGGDDLYLARAGGADPEMPVSLVVDLSGNDIYRCKERGSQGAGLSGVGLLADLGEGNDLYEGGDLAQGAGLLGVGILVDGGGWNLFRAGKASQGAGLLGAGLLVAGRGPDVLEGEAPCQGTSGPGGAGILLDRGGSDSFGAGGEGTPSSPLPSQGGGAGWAEVWASGGTGLLLDMGGNDAYRAGRAAQGVGFFRGGGILLDTGGEDRFQCGRWSQGMGAGRGVGLLMEGWGDTRYDAGDSAQGMGHDLGLGMLVDLAGMDDYKAGAVSQGAGSRHGSGFLFDLTGDDARAAFPGPAGGAQGWAGVTGGWGSLGLLIDCGGKDHNSEGPEDGGRKVRGGGGLAIDSGGMEKEPASGKTVPPFPPVVKKKAPTLLALEKDLHQALSSLPGSPPWKAAVRDFSRGGKEALEWLAARTLASPTPAMAALFQEAALARGGEAAAVARKGLAEPSPQARALAARVLGLLGDGSSRDSLKDLLEKDLSSQVRRAAAEALGRLGLPAIPEGLEGLLRSPFVLDRIAAASCLEGVETGEGVFRLLSLLDDPAWPVRRRAENALAARGSDAAGPVQEKLKEAKGAGRISLVRILGRIRVLSSRPFLLPLLEDPDPVLRAEVVRSLRSLGNKGDLEKLKAMASVEMNPLVQEALKGL